MIDSMIIQILLLNFTDGMMVTDIMKELSPNNHMEYTLVANRCICMVDIGILQNYKKNNTVFYRLVRGI